MKKIVIIGSNGFVGSNLRVSFEKIGYKVTGIDKKEMGENDNYIRELLNGAEVIINLAGVPVVGKWTQGYKKALRESRIDTTQRVVALIGTMSERPKLYISTSAVGIYDDKAEYDEDGNFANDFLSKLCQDWEAEALRVTNFGVREVTFRFGIVLGKDGGALKQMLLPFKLGVGGKIGSGKQGVSFVHIEDLVKAYHFIIDNESLSGIFNLSSPKPTTNLEMTKALGKSLRRPTLFPVPEFALKLIFGEGAKVLTDGQKVIPKRLIEAGFEFKFQTIEETIDSLVK